jgi:hypothetical protein
MFYIVFEKYCKDKLGCHAYEFLDISRGCWYRFQKENILPLRYCKDICYDLKSHIIDDKGELTLFISSKYYSEVN